jgi:hypothetical protein
VAREIVSSDGRSVRLAREVEQGVAVV